MEMHDPASLLKIAAFVAILRNSTGGVFERRACAHEANTDTRILPHNCRRQAAPMLCLLWVISGHLQCKYVCQLYPRKRTCAVQLAMSAKCQERTWA